MSEVYLDNGGGILVEFHVVSPWMKLSDAMEE
jgi:hypothetical protein